jgi:DNA repair protein RadC
MKKFKTTIPQFNLRKIQTEFPKAKIGGSKDGAEFIRQFYGDDIDIFESFFILMLNNSNNTIGYAKISQGGITGTVVDIRIIAKYCVDSLATACIMAHNHPSGKLAPSMADKQITEKIVKGLALLDIKVLDHLILVSEGNAYYSFADENEESIK